MHPLVFQEFQAICGSRSMGGRILEVGAVASDESLLTLPALANASVKVGINLKGMVWHRDLPIIQGDANRLPFRSGMFDAVICNAVLEHDRFFWKTIAEMKRVTRGGGVIVIGTPGYTETSLATAQPWLRALRLLGRRTGNWLDAALTLPIHNYPGDYYRFSPQAFEEVFFAGLIHVEVRSLLIPPRIIGVGVVPDDFHSTALAR